MLKIIILVCFAVVLTIKFITRKKIKDLDGFQGAVKKSKHGKIIANF